MGNTSSIDNSEFAYAAFFDLDDTILTVSSGKVLIQEAHRQGIMRKRDLLRSMWFAFLYKINLAHSTRVTMRMASWLRGTEEDYVVELINQLFDDELVDKISESVSEEIEFHRGNGAKLIMLSAALDYVCRPIVRHLELDDLVCSHMEVVDGIFTGMPSGKLVFGPEKGTRLIEYCSIHGFDPMEAYCYADSYSDLSMMEKTGHPVAVRPDRRLGNAAKKRGWKVIKG
jgi:HAD superfamily hydrolase (TIGR01490 family)